MVFSLVSRLFVGCFLHTLKYEVSSDMIWGDVISDYMNLLVLTVDDTTPLLSTEYILQNGIFQGKYERGSRWEVTVDMLKTFPGSIYLVGLYANNQCHTDYVLINLPLNSCCEYFIRC